MQKEELKKEKSKESISSSSEKLYSGLRKMVLSMPPGSPMPPVHLLKSTYHVGYLLLNNVLKKLEAEKLLVIKHKKGIFVIGNPPADPSLESQAKESPPLQSLFSIPMTLPTIELLLFEHCKIHVGTWIALAKDYNSTKPFCNLNIREINVKKLSDLNTRKGYFDLVVASSNLELGCVADKDYLYDLSDFVRDFKPELPLFDFTWIRSHDGPVTGVLPAAFTPLAQYHPEAAKRVKVQPDVIPTYEEFFNTCRKLKNFFPEHFTFISQGYMEHLYRMGIPLFDPEKREIALTPQSLRPFFDYFYAMIKTEKMTCHCAELYEFYYNANHNAALFTQPAIFESSLGLSPSSPMPLNENGHYLLVGHEICIGRNSLYPEESLGFLNYLLSERGQRVLAANSGLQPAAKDLKSQVVSKEIAATTQLTVSLGKPAYLEDPNLFEARFMIQMFLDYGLQKKMSLETLCSELKNRYAKFFDGSRDRFMSESEFQK